MLGVTYLDASPDSEASCAATTSPTPTCATTRGTFAHSYGTDQLPESFVIDRQGSIVAISRGEIDQAFLDHAIALAREHDEAPRSRSARALLRAPLAPALAHAAPGARLARQPAPRTSLPIIERQVMCVTCKIPLNVAESPQAEREREYIQGLIDQG